MDSTVSKHISTTQINILLRAAHKLHAIALQHGNDQQERMAVILLDGVKIMAPHFTYEAPPPRQYHKRRKHV